MNRTMTLSRGLTFAAIGLCLIAGIVNLVSGDWLGAVGMLSLGFGFGLRGLVPSPGARWLQVLTIVLFAIAFGVALLKIYQRLSG